MTREELEKYLDALLSPQSFEDYGPNGLQIEGRPLIGRLAFAVSATQESISIACEREVHALVVHHGLFWKFHGVQSLTGPFGKRVFPLVRNEISLFGYHLPLDAHPDIGNAACLGDLINLGNRDPFGRYKGCPTGIRGRLSTPITALELKEKLEQVLHHPVMMATPDPVAMIETVGIITGGANSEWRLAADDGLDAYVSGEMSEHDWHESREAGVHMFAGGHHATERFGVQALMRCIQRDFDVECFFIDSQNPA